MNLKVKAFVLYPGKIKLPKSDLNIGGVFTTEHFALSKGEWETTSIEEGVGFSDAPTDALAELEGYLFENKANNCVAIVITDLIWSKMKGA